MRVMEGVGVLASSFVGVEGTVGVCEREEELECVGRVIARRKRSFSGIVRAYAWFQLLCSCLFFEVLCGLFGGVCPAFIEASCQLSWN